MKRLLNSTGKIVVLTLVTALLSSCSAKKEDDPNATAANAKGFPVRVQLDWFPEPEHGGLYQALAKGYFAQEGLDVKLMPGGSNVLVTQFVAANQAEIGQSATTQIIYAIAGGQPVINVASIFHRMPTGLMMHEGNPVASFKDLDGKTIIGRPESVYIPYLKKKYGIKFTVLPQNYGLSQFIQDPKTIQEGFFIAEPYYIVKEGVKVKWLALWDSGYDPAVTIFTSASFAKDHPEQLKAFLRAFVKGWKDYLEGDPSPGDALMKKDNPKIDDGFLKYERDQILKYNLGRGDPAKGEDYGTLSLDKVKSEIAIMEDLKLIDPGKVTVEKAATNDYLPAPPRTGP